MGGTGRGSRETVAQPQSRRRAGVEAAPADVARVDLRTSDPARRVGSRDGQRRRCGNPRAGAPVAGQRCERATQGHRLAVP